MIKSEQINELATALAKAQSEILVATKDAKGYGYNYAKLEDVIAAVKPSLNKNNISFVQLIEDSGSETVSKVTTLLLHSSGQFLGSTGTIGVPEMKGCNLAQRHGASQTFLKRYQLQALTGLPTEDNDASSEGFSKSSSVAVSTKVGVEATSTTQTTTTTTAPVVNGKSTNFSNRARQLRSTNGGEQLSTTTRNESF